LWEAETEPPRAFEMTHDVVDDLGVGENRDDLLVRDGSLRWQ
jgi:hypothetical protein